MLDNIDPIFSFLSVALVIKLLSSYVNQGRRPNTSKCVGKVTELVLYPVKSMGGMDLREAKPTQKGLKYPDEPLFDRSFMVISKEGVFKTARTIPKLTTIKPRVQGHHVILECDGIKPLMLPKVALRDSAKKLYKTEVFGQRVEGQDCGDEAAEWISACVNTNNLRIVYNMDGILQRELNKQDGPKDRWDKTAKDGDKAVFHDGYPYLLISKASLYDLNDRLDKHVPMKRFRPNIVIEGCPPYDEDKWDEVWIGEVKFTNIKQCDRCSFTTVDPFKGILDSSGEPLKTLKTYRLNEPVFGTSPLFGVHLVLDSHCGKHIKVGDEVHVVYKQ